MSRTLQGSELHYPAIEKETTAIMKRFRKCFHLLLRKTFTLVRIFSTAAVAQKLKITKSKNEEWHWHLILMRLSVDQENKILDQILFLEHFMPI